LAGLLGIDVDAALNLEIGAGEGKPGGFLADGPEAYKEDTNSFRHSPLLRMVSELSEGDQARFVEPGENPLPQLL